jgi:hypothetical protein
MATLSSLLPASVVTNLAAGDSDVAVTDSGTGKIEFTVDNVEVADFTTGEVVFNETGANQDFRVEGDSNANLLIADAGVDKVGIGTNTFNTNGGVLQVSNGISFPATQSACADANTLDDYEEGTWTPTLGGSSSDPTSTYVQQNGTYTKIGNIVTVNFNLYTSAISGGSGFIKLQGLPFPCANAGHDVGTAFVYNLTLSPVGSLAWRFDNTNATFLFIEVMRDDDTPLPLSISDWPTSVIALVRGNITYRAA